MKYLGRIEDSKDATNKGYVDSGLSSKVPTSDYAPVAKTSDMTQAVGKDANGQLWTEPGVITVTVTGTTPTITAEANHRYVCGEVSTLDIILPASGIVDVTFESGNPPTVLTITPPLGVALKWENNFDPTKQTKNKNYEINIMDGLGVASWW